MKRRSWTVAEVEQLRKLRAAGMKCADIGERINRSLESIYGAVFRYGLDAELSRRQISNQLTDSDAQKILQLRREGLSLRAIARRLGRTPGQVVGKWDRMRGRSREMEGQKLPAERGTPSLPRLAWLERPMPT